MDKVTEFLGNYWWLWLIAIGVFGLVSYMFYNMKKWLCEILDDEDAAEFGEQDDPEPPVPEKQGLMAIRSMAILCKFGVYAFKCAAVASFCALIVSATYLLMQFICR